MPPSNSRGPVGIKAYARLPTDDALVAGLANAFDVRPDELRSPTVLRWADQHRIGGCDGERAARRTLAAVAA